LYCDASVYDPFSAFHPISFRRVLPFQSQDPVADDPGVLEAEAAHLACQHDNTRRGVVDAYARYGLLSPAEADNVKSVIDFYDGAGFFELMGQVYANAGMFICALRWYRELIQALENRDLKSHPGLDDEGVHASIGYCLYALGLYAEAIAWTKSCIGPLPTVEAVCLALIDYEAQLAGGRLLAIERATSRTRYTVSAFDPAHTRQTTPRLVAAMKAFAPDQEFYIDWVGQDAPPPGIQPEGYPFRVERDSGDLPRHKMNLIFATCGQADALVEKGYTAEAKRLLYEAAQLEPAAGFVRDRITALT
jgi:tetratricopeptide (TPR) repeat protein